MKNCPYCGQQNPEENRYCNKCGKELTNGAVPEVTNSNVTASNNMAPNIPQTVPSTRSIWDFGVVKFILYIYSIFLPPIGLLFGLLVSLTPFQNQCKLSRDLIHTACICMIIWPIVVFLFAFANGFFSSI